MNSETCSNCDRLAREAATLNFDLGDKDQEIARLEAVVTEKNKEIIRIVGNFNNWKETIVKLEAELKTSKSAYSDLLKNSFREVRAFESERDRMRKALEEIKFVSHLFSHCEHPEGKCPWKIAEKALQPEGAK